MEHRAVQDVYPDDVAHCYGCGRLNAHGLHVRSMWDGDATLATIVPRPEHTAIPGFVYGGLIASLVDCHGTGSAALAAYRAEGREPGTEPALRFVTASLTVDYLRPTPLGPPIEVRGTIVEVKPRKVEIAVTVTVAGVLCARGRVVAVRMPESFRGGGHVAAGASPAGAAVRRTDPDRGAGDSVSVETRPTR